MNDDEIIIDLDTWTSNDPKTNMLLQRCSKIKSQKTLIDENGIEKIGTFKFGKEYSMNKTNVMWTLTIDKEV